MRDTLFADDATVWMGTRLGALVATQVSAGPLVMWDPVFDPNSYFREILRASVFSAFRSDDPGTAPKTDLIRHLRSAGEIDLLGYQVTERFYREVCEAPPLGAVDMNGRQVMMVDIRRRGTPRNETIRLAETWRTGSAAVRVEAVPLNEPWWYGARAGTAAQDGAEANDALLTLTADFVDDREHVES